MQSLTEYHLLACFGVLLGPVAQLFLKLGTHRVRNPSGWYAVPLHPLSVSGYLVMLVSACIYYDSLRVVPLKDFVFILPFAYAFTPILSWLILSEIITGLQWVSIVLIVIGVLIFNIKI
jgi:drug/metabolite transporter (DMT)-like permease